MKKGHENLRPLCCQARKKGSHSGFDGTFSKFLATLLILSQFGEGKSEYCVSTYYSKVLQSRDAHDLRLNISIYIYLGLRHFSKLTSIVLKSRVREALEAEEDVKCKCSMRANTCTVDLNSSSYNEKTRRLL